MTIHSVPTGSQHHHAPAARPARAALALLMTIAVAAVAACSGATGDDSAVREVSCTEVADLDTTPTGDEESFRGIVVDVSPSIDQADLRDDLTAAALGAIDDAAGTGARLVMLQATADSVGRAETVFDGSLAGQGVNDFYREQDARRRVAAAACSLERALVNPDPGIRRSDLVGALWRLGQEDRASATDCSITVASDGYHNSGDVDLRRDDAVDRIQAAGLLPDLTGCDLTVTHLGRSGDTSANPSAGPRLLTGWQHLARAAGATLITSA